MSLIIIQSDKIDGRTCENERNSGFEHMITDKNIKIYKFNEIISVKKKMYAWISHQLKLKDQNECYDHKMESRCKEKMTRHCFSSDSIYFSRLITLIEELKKYVSC